MSSPAKLDLVVGSIDEPSLTVLEGHGDGTFSAPVQTLAVPGIDGGFGDVALADLNRDGRLDLIAAASAADAVVVALGDAPLHFAAPGVVDVGATPSRLAVRDLNGDAIADVLVATSTGIVLLRGRGDGSFAEPENVMSGDAVADIALFDANGDQLEDIVAAVPGRDAVRVFDAEPGGNFVAGPEVTVDEPLALAVGEFTGDTELDVAVFAGRSGDIVVLPGAGAGFGAPLTVASGVSASRLLSADVNGDARTDLIANDARSGVLQTVIGGAQMPFAVVTSSRPAPQSGVAVADFDGDGLADLVSIAPVTSEPEVLPAPVPPAPAPCPGDCDHDGTVGIDELIAGVRLALGDPALSCNALDRDADGTISVDELVAAAGSALDGCAASE